MSSKESDRGSVQRTQLQAARQVTRRKQCEFLATRRKCDVNGKGGGTGDRGATQASYDALRRSTAGSGEPGDIATPFFSANRSAFFRSSPISQMSSFMALLGGTMPRS